MASREFRMILCALCDCSVFSVLTALVCSQGLRPPQYCPPASAYPSARLCQRAVSGGGGGGDPAGGGGTFAGRGGGELAIPAGTGTRCPLAYMHWM